MRTAIDTKISRYAFVGGTVESRADAALLRKVVVSNAWGRRRNVFCRQYIELNGLRRSDVAYVVHNNSLINIVRALVERVFFVEGPGGILVEPPQTTRAVFYRHMEVFRGKLLGELEPVFRMCLRTFVRTSPTHKVKIYEHARKQYITHGLLEQDAWVTSFIKAEKVSDKKTDPAPRIIQPRGVKFNLIYGCFIRPAEKAVYAAIDRVYGRPTVVCGQNAVQQAAMLYDAWNSIVDPVAISYDLSRMDQHVSEVALRWEHSVYRRMFTNDHDFDTLDWCLRQTVKNQGCAYTVDEYGNPKKVKYTKVGSRMSGDMNTSLGNKLLMCAMLYSYFTVHLGFVVSVDYAIVDNGDDCVVIMSRRAYTVMQQMTTGRPQLLAVYDPARWNVVYIAEVINNVMPSTHKTIMQFFTELGFTLKEEGFVNEFEKIEFCQTQPCFIDGRWIMVRGLNALSKDCYCLKHWNQYDAWVAQVSSAGVTCYGSVPIYGAFYSAMCSHRTADRHLLEASGLFYLSQGVVSGGVVTDENRISFFNTFGVTPREQVLIEQHYHNLVRLSVNDVPSYGTLLPV